MRCDLLLSRLCLFKTRSQAGNACEGGRVWINGEKARPSKDVKSGDRIRFQDRLGRYEQEVEILMIPQGSVSRAEAREHVRLLSRRRIEDLWSSDEPSGSEE